MHQRSIGVAWYSNSSPCFRPLSFFNCTCSILFLPRVRSNNCCDDTKVQINKNHVNALFISGVSVLFKINKDLGES